MEAELSESNTRANAAENTQTKLRTEIDTLNARLAALNESLAISQHDLQTERNAKDAALLRATRAKEQMNVERVDAQQRIEALNQDHDQHLREALAMLATKEEDLRKELARATERLEGVQKHVMLQVSEAREAQKRAEDQLMKATQRGERLVNELEPLRMQVATLKDQLQRATLDHTAAVSNTTRLQAERDDLVIRLSNMTGRLELVSQQLAELQLRAQGSRSHDSRRPTKKQTAKS